MNASNDCRCPGCGQCEASRLIELIKKVGIDGNCLADIMIDAGNMLSKAEFKILEELMGKIFE